MKVNIIPYIPEYKKQWNDFIASTNNGTFLHNRNFMDYHHERFKDFSLMIYEKDVLIALLPANIKNDTLYSHSGLTYGEILFSKKIKTNKKTIIIKQLLNFINKNKIKTWHIKSIPTFFNQVPDETAHYLYPKMGAEIYYNVGYYYLNKENYHLNKNRKRNIHKADKSLNLKISYNPDHLFDYWKIVEENLKVKHNAKPVHSYKEMASLIKNFPTNIKVATISNGNMLLGGVVLFIINNVLHFQYINSTLEKKARSSIDYLVNEIIKDNLDKYKYISLGSAENRDGSLNKGLVYWKESFGASVFNQYYFKFNL